MIFGVAAMLISWWRHPQTGYPTRGVRLRGMFTAQLYRRLGERRIDVLVCARDQIDGRAVVAAARRDGVELTRT